MAKDIRPAAQWPAIKGGGRGVAIALGYLIEIAPGEYTPTNDSSAATHGHLLFPGNEIRIAPLSVLDDSVRTTLVGGKTLIPHVKDSTEFLAAYEPATAGGVFNRPSSASYAASVSDRLADYRPTVRAGVFDRASTAAYMEES